MSTAIHSDAPPAPYKILEPRAVTKEFDIKRWKISNQWEGLGDDHLDKVIRETDEHVYARACAPEGCAILGEDDTPVFVGDLCFQSKIGEWKKFEDLYAREDEGKTVGELRQQATRFNWIFFARELPSDDESTYSQETIRWSIPPGYRLLDPGEVQRYGDKYKGIGFQEWAPVDDISRGRIAVPPRESANGCYTYIRPISERHRFWHINRETGCDESGDGTEVSPWKTAQHAIRKIESGATKLGLRLYGSIIDMNTKEGVHHYDMDEPEPEPLPVEMVSEPVDPPQMHRYFTLDDVVEASGIAKRFLGEVESASYPKHWRKQDVHRYMMRLKERFPTYRIMYLGETLKQGDLICKKVSGKRTWVPCAAGEVGTEVEHMPELCARDSLPSHNLESFEAKLDAMTHKLHDAMDFVTLLKAEYLKLKLM